MCHGVQGVAAVYSKDKFFAFSITYGRCYGEGKCVPEGTQHRTFGLGFSKVDICTDFDSVKGICYSFSNIYAIIYDAKRCK